METKPAMNQQYLQFMQQLVELQKENITQCKVRLDATDEDWMMFVDTWTCYKKMCELMDPAVIWYELRIVCTPDVNRLVFGLVGAKTLNSATDEQLLRQIQLIDVRELHKEVHRENFHSMRKKEEESITHFLAQLWALAKFSVFIVTCPNKTLWLASELLQQTWY